MLISNAQNFEDVILWRALKDVDGGFYIDIGAQDPVDDSVSLLFYEQGWRGIHVEPSEEYALKLRGARPDEEVVEALVGVHEGVSTFFQIGTSGLSTGSEALANKYRDAGWSITKSQKNSVRLASLLDRCRDRDVHWLKIDVEGMEAAVIDSWHPSDVRPWILVVESTIPNSEIQDHHEWEPLVIEMGYVFVYFDGLNRFYVHNNHSNLLKYFGPGPNVFDGFILGASRQYFHQLNLQLLRSEQANSRLRVRLDATAGEVRQRDEQLSSLQAATEVMARHSETLAREITQKSQRLAELEEVNRRMLTAVERLSDALSPPWLVQGVSAWLLFKPGSRPRRIAGRLARAGVGYLRDKPRAKAAAIRLTALVPSLQAGLFRLAAQQRAATPELDILAGREWYLEPEPAMQTKWAALLRDRLATKKAGH